MPKGCKDYGSADSLTPFGTELAIYILLSIFKKEKLFLFVQSDG